MPVTRPYRRTCRQFTDGGYENGGKANYIYHPSFARLPSHYVRAFLVIQKDLLTLFDYIEPADLNCQAYSFRTHELLLRTCIEIEANCKAILIENGYRDHGRLNITDYHKINNSHLMSAYEVTLPVWNGSMGIRKPYENWDNTHSLPWYTAYNNSKHDRLNNFPEANFNSLIDAVCGLIAILSAQFLREDFNNNDFSMSYGGPSDGTSVAIGSYFKVRFPEWPIQNQYDFEFRDLAETADPFQNFPYR